MVANKIYSGNWSIQLDIEGKGQSQMKCLTYVAILEEQNFSGISGWASIIYSVFKVSFTATCWK